MMYIHSYRYETNPYNTSGKKSRRGRHRKRSKHPTSDYLFCLICCTILILVSYLLINFGYDKYYNASGSGHDNKIYIYKGRQQRQYYHHGGQLLYPLFTRSLVMCVMYLWSKRNPTQQINLNFVPIQGQYLPFAHVALSYGTYVRSLVDV